MKAKDLIEGFKKKEYGWDEESEDGDDERRRDE